ncbi:MAG: ABC-F family ATP-binding cassette domain-containing protein [Spirochaetales bacterium]|nr:ABC-F family ATP-binding cassette domain-containing protein [Spirochaetales bacterium]
MPSVNLYDISVSFGAERILESVNLSIAAKDRLALTGANGSGKTTLMRIIAGEVVPDSGRIVREKDTRVGYLPQTGVTFRDMTVAAAVERSFDEITPLLEEMREIESRLESVKKDSEETCALLEHYHYLHETIITSEYYSREEAIHRVLTGLGFSEEEFHKPISSFSSGWQMRIALACVLLGKPDIMMLDEPTNYLDIEARQWLKTFLNSFEGGILIVSHDRFFLDEVVGKVAEIYGRKVTVYTGNYTAYERKRAAELERIIESYKRQQEEISKIELFIKRFRYNSSKAKLVQSRIHYLEKLDRIEKPPGLRSIHFQFPSPPPPGDMVVEVDGLGKSYNGKEVFGGVSFVLKRGERLVLTGINGAGKSTLIGILAGTLEPDAGIIRYGSNVATGYFSQDHLSGMKKETSIIDELESSAPTEMIPHLRNLLGAFLFGGNDVYKSLSVLSGGEQSRIHLIKLLLNPANLLLLDEPTNHLDMVSNNILLDVLKNSGATLVFVSHDRYFIRQLATKVYELESGKGTLYHGDYEYYLWKKASFSINQKLEETDQTGKKRPDDVRSKREADRQKKNRLRKLKEEEAEILTNIERLGTEKKGFEHSMADESVYRDGERMKSLKEKLSDCERAHARLFERWEQVEEEIRILEKEIKQECG